jgi:hypothetical protein
MKKTITNSKNIPLFIFVYERSKRDLKRNKIKRNENKIKY